MKGKIFSQDFLSAQQAISFFIRFYLFRPAEKCVQLENQNNEKLEIKVVDEDYEVVISRYPIGATDEWIKEMNHKSRSKWSNQYRNIIIR